MWISITDTCAVYVLLGYELTNIMGWTCMYARV